MGGVQTETDEAKETSGRASCLARPVCDAFSIAKIKTGRKRHLPQFHRAETAGFVRDECPYRFVNVAVGPAQPATITVNQPEAMPARCAKRGIATQADATPRGIMPPLAQSI